MVDPSVDGQSFFSDFEITYIHHEGVRELMDMGTLTRRGKVSFEDAIKGNSKEPKCEDFVVREDGLPESFLLVGMWLCETFRVLRWG